MKKQLLASKSALSDLKVMMFSKCFDKSVKINDSEKQDRDKIEVHRGQGQLEGADVL